MSSKKEFYDQGKVFETYRKHRKRSDNPNDALEKPVFLELVGQLRDLDIVDLGCGDGSFGLEALSKGARSYLGIEISREMARAAKDLLSGTAGQVQLGSIEAWHAENAQADLVCSRLSLNYIENLQPVFREVFKALRPNGRFIISVEHPVISSNYAHLEKGKRTSWLVDNYFQTGARKHSWLGEDVTKYHHTLEDWLRLFKATGLTLEDIRESHPKKEHFHSMQEYERRLRIPLFLFVSARKPV